MTDIILTVVLEVVKCLAPPTQHQIRYLRSYNNNFENLKNEIGKMKDDSASVQHTVDEAKRKGEDIEKNVEIWLESVNNVVYEAEELMAIYEATANKRCVKGLCPNLKNRLQRSKEAVRQLEAISKLREAGRFDRISYLSIPEDIRLLASKDYEAFESRMFTLKNILTALKDPCVNMLGIYGMGGIGKTTLAKEVARQAESNKLFDQVVFAEVFQSQGIRKIQGEIADKLGLKFSEESESGRARSLYNRLKKEKRILVILDNIWENLDLLAVGIPHGDHHKGCKVLLTARSEDVLSRKMDSQRNFFVGVLTEEEAWSLFKKMAGDYIEGSEFKSVATDVVMECAGLPVSIVTVARALRNKRLFEWNDALEQLRRPSSMNFRNIQSTAYSAILLSYNYLESEELKKVFLLIGYTTLKSVDDLLIYGMGLGLFQGINLMDEARARVRTLVQKLKASCMLLDHISEDEELFSMHDVVRDVAIALASTKQNVLTVTNGELVNRWDLIDESTVKFYTSIVLLGVKANVLPKELKCPQLKFFYIRAADKYSYLKIPDNFFLGMTQVRVLNLSNMQILSWPSSLGLLTSLRTLCLYSCKLQDIAVVGNLKRLEILCIRDSDIKQLPEEIGQLTRLMLLDLRCCWNLEVIPPNVLSKLSYLEELYIGYCFNKWEVEVEGLKNASLDELKYLPNLTSLELQIKDANTLPRGLFFAKLEKYIICIGDESCWSHKVIPTKISRTFKLELNTNICLKDGLIVRLKAIEDLHLCRLKGQDFNTFVYELVKVDSLQLKNLVVEGCDFPCLGESKRCEESTTNMWSNGIIFEDDSLFIEKVVVPNLETLHLRSIFVRRIWQNQLAAKSCGIQNLTSLIIQECWNLRCLFSSSIVSSFVQLQKLKIENCPVLEDIIVVDQAEMKNVMLPQLQFLKMRDLKKLTSFCTGDLHIEFPSLRELMISECPEFMVKYKSSSQDLEKKVSIFPNLKYLRVKVKHMPWTCQFTEDFLYKLKRLYVELDESTIIPSLNLLQRFHTIKILRIYGGYAWVSKEEFEIWMTDEVEKGMMDEVENGMTDEVENGMTAILRLINKFCDMKHILKPSAILDNLEQLEIWSLDCDDLINLMPSSPTFKNLTTLNVWSCKRLNKLITSSTAKSLERLRKMRISQCLWITEIVVDDEEDNAAKDEIVFRALKKLELSYLYKLASFYSGNCAFKFPSLETLVVEDCIGMKIFCAGELSTPMLHKVLNKERCFWDHDLNTTIKQLYPKPKDEDEEATKGNNEEKDAAGSVSVLKRPRTPTSGITDYQNPDHDQLLTQLSPEVAYSSSRLQPWSLDDLPRTEAVTFHQGSTVLSMDFHPSHQTLLLVGSSNGEITLWELVMRDRLVSKPFKIWDMTACSLPFQASIVQDVPISVSRVAWSPEGNYVGVAFTKHLIQLYSYAGSNDLHQHLQIDAHVGTVNDLAFAHPIKQLCVVSCGDDKLIKVWDLSGQKLFNFEGHEAPVYSICPHHKENIQFILSTATDGKIKTWLYDNMGYRADFDVPGNWCTTMLYSADGSRLVSCGTSKDGDPFLVEWDESEGKIKRTYAGFRKKSNGVVQFDTTQNHFLAVGEDCQIKFWDMDNVNVLTSTEAEGGLPSLPRLRFSKEGNLLAVTTADNGFKILANAVSGRSAVSSAGPANYKVERSSPVGPSPIINGVGY